MTTIKKKTLINLGKKMIYLNIIISLAFVLSCNKSDTVTETAPSNLSVNVTVLGADDTDPNGDGSGTVQVTASADNATRYAFRFDNGDLQESPSGSTEYTFTKNGTNSYTIVAWAYSASGAFINETVNIEVFKSDQAFTTLLFSDEFDYEGTPNPEKWHHQVIPPNNGSWNNGELQHYTDRIDNSFVSDGTLKIKAIEEEYTTGGSTKSYTSARLNSKFAFTYGRVEVKAKLPSKAGTWPAIWTLGANIDETGNYFGDQYGSVGWPASGEIDIMEQTGANKTSTITHFHWGDTNTQEYKNTGTVTQVPNTSEEFHTYSLEWDSSTMKVSIDDEVVFELPNSTDKPYNHPQYLLLNLAMGGSLGGTVPENFGDAVFEVDYVRIYQ